MVRGRPMNTALPETRGLVQQRNFRAKKAEKIAELESTNRALVEENRQLRTEIQLLRDHLLNPDATNLPLATGKKDLESGEEIRIQMGVVQGVRDQLENALKSLKAIGGDAGSGMTAEASPMSMTSGMTESSISRCSPAFQTTSYGAYEPRPQPSTNQGDASVGKKCCKPTTTSSTSGPAVQQAQYNLPNGKRQRQDSPNRSTLLQARQQDERTEDHEYTMNARPPSMRRDISPPIMDPRGVPPINGAECCLGIVACDEQGEILGWSS